MFFFVFFFDAAYSKKDSIEKKKEKICTEKPATCFWNFVISCVTSRIFNQVENVYAIMLRQKRPNEENKTLNIPISLFFSKASRETKFDFLNFEIRPPRSSM